MKEAARGKRGRGFAGARNLIPVMLKGTESDRCDNSQKVVAIFNPQSQYSTHKFDMCRNFQSGSNHILYVICRK